MTVPNRFFIELDDPDIDLRAVVNYIIRATGSPIIQIIDNNLYSVRVPSEHLSVNNITNRFKNKKSKGIKNSELKINDNGIYQCKICNQDFKAKKSDRLRGWGVYCSKSCKANDVTANHHKYDAIDIQLSAFQGVKARRAKSTGDCPICGENSIFCHCDFNDEMGWDAHKDSGF